MTFEDLRVGMFVASAPERRLLPTMRPCAASCSHHLPTQIRSHLNGLNSTYRWILRDIFSQPRLPRLELIQVQHLQPAVLEHGIWRPRYLGRKLRGRSDIKLHIDLSNREDFA